MSWHVSVELLSYLFNFGEIIAIALKSQSDKNSLRLPASKINKINDSYL